MYPVSQDFLNTVRRGGRRKTVADLYFNQLLTKADVAVSDWSIRAASGSIVRVSGSCTIADPLLIPTFFSDDSLVIPAGAELIIRTGFVYSGGAEELVPLGVFTIESVSWKDGRSSEIQIDFYDRGRIIERFGWSKSADFSGQSASVALETMVNDTASYYELDADLTGMSNYVLPGGTVFDSDRGETIITVAKNMGGQVYFDRLGTPVLNAITTIDQSTTSDAAVWTINAGEDGVLVEADKGLSRDGVYNAVAVYGAAPDDGQVQPYAVAKDNNPSSPTYFDGPFGQVWQRIEDSSLTDNSQCQVVADATLAQVTGLVKSISFQLVPNPALDIDDIILVKYYDDSEELHVIDSYELSPSSMSATTRSIQFIKG